MRVPNRITVKDAFSRSVNTGTHAVTPGGGDGTFPTGTGGVGQPGVTNPVLQFRDTSTNSPTTWSWEFKRNGTVIGTSAQQNPMFTFPAAGAYEVTLTTNVGAMTHDVTVA